MFVGGYFSDHFIQSLLLIGPEGAAIFSLLVFRKVGIEGVWRRVRLATFTIVAATAAAVAVALVGKPILMHIGITLGAVSILGGAISIKTGAEVFRIDFLKPFRVQREEGASASSEAIGREMPKAREATSVAKKWSIMAAARGLFRDFVQVGVPLVFPTSVGPAYTAWLFTQAGHAPVFALMAVIVCSMVVTLLAMLLVLLSGEKLLPAWVETTLEKFGAVIFVLFGIGTLIEGIMQMVS
jgi:small neutral amino acid transporter SnatA (MarC family)